MKKILIVIIPFFLVKKIYSQIFVPQGGCSINTISTNPDNYQNSNDPNELKLWDWRDEDYTVYEIVPGNGTVGIPTIIRSPFFDMNSNPNTIDLVDPILKDFKPKNGWELIIKDFGSPTQGVSHPYFILYNKYSGTIRCFINIPNAGGLPHNAAKVQLQFSNGSSQTAMLNQLGSSTYAINKFKKNATSSVANEYVNSGLINNYFWTWADFTSLYDPCTCGFETRLNLKVNLISEYDVDLDVNGTITGVVSSLSPGSSEVKNDDFFTQFKTYLGLANSILKSANKGYETGEKFKKDADKFVQNNSGLVGKQKAKEISRNLAALIYEAPTINQVINTASTVISVVKKIKGIIDPKPEKKVTKSTVTNFNTKLEVGGTISLTAPYGDFEIGNPGSDQTNLANFRKCLPKF